jgi:hypothetical protein
MSLRSFNLGCLVGHLIAAHQHRAIVKSVRFIRKNKE